ncbi:MAG: alpha/beta hydrolase [Patescibacteria group bacterium]|nr:alpha/beta hydrolase [Patescibacteria group bacterium]MDE1940735.1 alpha/beta hydrolase [Patescibacteria group bacterium]MDE1966494.1 alpha/beta hydrolase [Patescibacteria group bacterium]
MKRQVIVIHGGDTPETYEKYIADLKAEEFDLEDARRKRWRETLEALLGTDFLVYTPRMPNSANAKYLEWKIWFDKIVPQIKDNSVLVGHSLGGIFLAKYLSENKLKMRLEAVLLVAAPFANDPNEKDMADFILPKSLDLLSEQGGRITIYHSTDDPYVDFKDAESYKERLPNAILKKFEGRGHFTGSEFPELAGDIKALFK